MLAEDSADLVLHAGAHVCLLELVDNAASHAVDHVDCEDRGLILVGCDYSEETVSKELVKEVSIRAEDCGQEVCVFCPLAPRAVLHLHVPDLLVWVQRDPPSVLRPHCRSVKAVALYLSFGFLDLSEVGGTFWSNSELDLRAQIHDSALALLRNCNYCLSGCFFITF